MRTYFAAATLVLALAAGPLAAAELRVLFTNDVQGHLSARNLMGERSSGGAAALHEIVAEERAALGEDEALLLFDAGDFLYGGLRAGAYDGVPAIEVMNAIGYDGAALGNHEFDRGPGVLRLRSRQARFPFLCANLYRAGTAFSPRGFRPSRLFPLPALGIEVGVVGVVDPALVPGTSLATRHGLEIGDPHAALVREVDRLRGQGADLVILLSHQGLEKDRALVARAPGLVDLVLGGHSPSARVDGRRAGVPILQARAEGIEVGRIRIPVEAGRPRVGDAAVSWLPWNAREAAPGGPIDAVLARFPLQLPALARTAGRFSLGETAGWLLDSLLASARVQGLRPSVALFNKGALRTSLPSGEVNALHLNRIAPFDNHLVVADYPAAALREIAAADRERGPRSRLLWRFDDGRSDPLEALPTSGTVQVVLNDFLLEGGDEQAPLTAALATRLLPETVREVLRTQLLATGGILAPPDPIDLPRPRSFREAMTRAGR